MNTRSFLTGSLLVATVTTGLMAGVFGAYAHATMRGLGKTDDRTFVGAFQAIDGAIVNPLFMSTFFGAALLSALSFALSFRGGSRVLVPWVGIATLLYLVAVVVTIAVHVPLNDGIKAAGDVDRITDLARVRMAFHETRWVVWNVVRALTSTLAFFCLAWALVLDGRSAPVSRQSAPPTWSAERHGQASSGPGYR